jgi:hypothetical protein
MRLIGMSKVTTDDGERSRRLLLLEQAVQILLFGKVIERPA